MNLSQIVNIVEIVNIIQILGIPILIYGMWIGLKRFKLLRIQRRDLAILECAKSFQEKEFIKAYRLLASMKPGQSIEQINALGKKYQIAILCVGMKFETIGLLVYKGVVPISAMEDLVGHAVITIWKVLKIYIDETRLVRSSPSFWEWYQWFVDRLVERGEYDRSPAYETHKNWKNPSF